MVSDLMISGLEDLLIIFYDFADVGILNDGQHKANFAEFI